MSSPTMNLIYYCCRKWINRQRINHRRRLQIADEASRGRAQRSRLVPSSGAKITPGRLSSGD